MKISKLQVTFDESSKDIIWPTVLERVKDLRCPFCNNIVTKEEWAGAAFIDRELRVFDKNIICLLEFDKRTTESV